MATTKKNTKKKRRKTPSTAPPNWLVTAMQGLAHWMGLRDSYFSSYPITEGALVVELSSLLAANLPTGLFVMPEYWIEKLTGVKPKTSPKKQGGDGRKPAVDLAIQQRKRRPKKHPDMCIEVKRWKQGSVHGDLDRLAAARKKGSGKWRGFVVVIAQNQRPEDHRLRLRQRLV